MPDETPLSDATRRAAFDALARQNGYTDWEDARARSHREWQRDVSKDVSAAIKPLQAAITALLAKHRPDGSHCEVCLDTYEDRVVWPCEPVLDVLDPLDLSTEAMVAIRNQFELTARHVPSAPPRARAHEEADRG
ncbi:hypothetical protein SUDANB95_05492 [Actinosynnema sp. ALI-1.44]